MYRIQTNYIKGLTKAEYRILTKLCRYSNNLYNVALYNIRQHYFVTHQFLTYESNYHECKVDKNYKMLQVGIAQQTMKVVDRSFKSFFNLAKKVRRNEYRFNDINMPYYRKKGDLFPLICSGNALSIKDGYFRVPLSNEFKKAYNIHSIIKIPFPDMLDGNMVKEVRILPYNNVFKIQYVYEDTNNDFRIDVDTEKILVIDTGIDNFVTCVDSSDGSSFIVDGHHIKSVNHYYNERLSYYRVIADHQHMVTTKLMENITNKRNRQIYDFILKTARHIIDYCLDHGIGCIVIGYNKSFEYSRDRNGNEDLNFIRIPSYYLRQRLCNLCQRYNMKYLEVEESYTSDASFLDGDYIPDWSPEQPYDGRFSGHRICRGLYESKSKRHLNADVNGACNILVKSGLNFDYEAVCNGILYNPLRIKLL